VGLSLSVTPKILPFCVTNYKKNLHADVVAKIENQAALDNLDEILKLLMQ
jgi:hypothetical protein